MYEGSFGVRSYAEAIINGETTFRKFDDSPIYTYLVAGLYYLVGSMPAKSVVFLNLLLGTASVVLMSGVCGVLLRNRIWALMSAVIMAAYGPFVLWEYDAVDESLYFFAHAFAIFSMVTFTRQPTRRRFFLVAFALCLLVMSKEIFVFLLPFYAFFLAFALAKKVSLRQQLVIIGSLLILALGARTLLSFHNEIKYGTSSSKGDWHMLAMLVLYGYFDRPVETKYPHILARIMDSHKRHIPAKDKDRNLTDRDIGATQAMARELIMAPIERNEYKANSLRPLLVEQILKDVPRYLRKTFIKFLYLSSDSPMSFGNKTNHPVDLFFDKHERLAWLHLFFFRLVLGCYALIGLIAGYLTYALESDHSVRRNIMGLGAYLPIYGFLMSGATYGEFGRLMLPTQFVLFPLLMIIFYYMWRSAQLRIDQHQG